MDRLSDFQQMLFLGLCFIAAGLFIVLFRTDETSEQELLEKERLRSSGELLDFITSIGPHRTWAAYAAGILCVAFGIAVIVVGLLT